MTKIRVTHTVTSSYTNDLSTYGVDTLEEAIEWEKGENDSWREASSKKKKLRKK